MKIDAETWNIENNRMSFIAGNGAGRIYLTSEIISADIHHNGFFIFKSDLLFDVTKATNLLFTEPDNRVINVAIEYKNSEYFYYCLFEDAYYIGIQILNPPTSGYIEYVDGKAGRYKVLSEKTIPNKVSILQELKSSFIDTNLDIQKESDDPNILINGNRVIVKKNFRDIFRVGIKSLKKANRGYLKLKSNFAYFNPAHFYKDVIMAVNNENGEFVYYVYMTQPHTELGLQITPNYADYIFNNQIDLFDEVYIELIDAHFLLDTESEQNVKTTELVVDINGVIGENCDFNSILTCLNSITDNNYYNRYQIFVKEGLYDVTGINYLPIKNYVNIIGENITKTVIRNSTPYIGDTGMGDQNVVCFDSNGNNVEYASISNMTLRIRGGKCCVHCDSDSGIKEGGMVELTSLQFIYEKGRSSVEHPMYGGVNCGLHNGQTIYIHDCFGLVEVYAHTSINSVKQKPSTFRVENCNLDWMGFYDLGIVSPGFKFIAKNNVVDTIGLGGEVGWTNKSGIINECSFNNVQQYHIKGGYDKFPVCDTIHRCVINLSGQNIERDKFVKIIDLNVYNPTAAETIAFTKGIEPYSSDYVYIGYTCDSFSGEEEEEGIIQIAGKIQIANANYKYGDYITLDDNGNPIKGSSEDYIGRIVAIRDSIAWLKLKQTIADMV